MGDRTACQDAGNSKQQYLLDIMSDIFNSQNGTHLS